MEEKRTETVSVDKKTEAKKKNPPITVKANMKGRHIMPLMNVLRVIIIPFYYLLKPFKFFGPRKVKDGACVYVSNHYGILDPVYVAATTWEGIHFISKRQTFETPVLGFFMRKVKAIKVNRDGNDIRAMLDSFKCLNNGEKIGIFPEGTRNKVNDEIRPFRHGAAAMAIKAKAPVVPIVMYTRPKFFRCTHILIGNPFELSEYYDKKLTETEYTEADEKIRNIMLELRASHTEYLANKKKGKKS